MQTYSPVQACNSIALPFTFALLYQLAGMEMLFVICQLDCRRFEAVKMEAAM
jgi:hypothetical protein